MGRQRSTASQRTCVKVGNRAEDGVAELHATCLVAGVANVRRVPTPMRLMRTGGQLRAVHSAKQGVDCRGWMLDGSARGVAVEVKRHSRPEKKFYLSQVTAEERADLDSALAGGCVAVLLVVTPIYRYAFAWRDVRDRVGITAAEMQPHRITDAAYLRRWADEASPAAPASAPWSNG